MKPTRIKAPADYDSRLAEFPAGLRELVEAELAAGNTIVELASCFPAPPAGAYVKLARSVTTRPRLKTERIDFHDRNASTHSGEWTDARRFYFVIEPPRPPQAEPNMDAIRAARNAAQATPVKDERRHVAPVQSIDASVTRAMTIGSAVRTDLVERFRSSMMIDYEKWHDGVGYDLALLAAATPPERQAIESMLVQRSVSDWRDVEALAAIGSTTASAALKAAMMSGSAQVRAAVIRYSPHLVAQDEKVAFLIEALRSAEFYSGLSEALDEVARFHPEAVVTALFEGALKREGAVAVHFAAMLLFIQGKAKVPFDWALRPFCLRFAGTSGPAREIVFHELCARLGVLPETILTAR